MSASLQRLLVRIGRWPRRIAALICLLLAAGSALVPHAARREPPTGRALRRGQVAVPVTVSSAGDVAAGDQVGRACRARPTLAATPRWSPTICACSRCAPAARA